MVESSRNTGAKSSPPMNRPEMIELFDLSKRYDTPSGGFHALKGISLGVARGSLAALVGKSGSGKSTLLNMISGIDRPTSGRIIINGEPIHSLSEGALSIWRGKNIGVVFQFFQLLPTLTVLENVMLPMDFTGSFPAKMREERAMWLLERTGIADQAHKFPAALSGGQQQRSAIARALANDPPLIVADEPTGNLDTRTAAGIFRLFEELTQSGKTVLVVTHERDLARYFEKCITIADGVITGVSDTRAVEGGASHVAAV